MTKDQAYDILETIEAYGLTARTILDNLFVDVVICPAAINTCKALMIELQEILDSVEVTQ